MRRIAIHAPPPVAALIERFARGRRPFVLDSAQGNDGLGRFSFFGADPFLRISGEGGHYRTMYSDGRTEHVRTKDGLAFLRETMRPYAGQFPAPEDLPFCGGAVGFLAYDYGRRIETIPDLAVDDRGMPELSFGLYDGVAALDHTTGILHLIALGIRGAEETVLAELRGMVEEAGTFAGEPQAIGNWVWNMEKADYLRAVEKVREFIARGDVYQVNFSQRARCPFSGDPVALYQALRTGNPAPYGAYLADGATAVLSSSPECFLRVRGREIATRPIKGTRPRGRTRAEDLENARSLRNSAKDRAELLMIVDLERNDLGRVAEYGSVRVTDLYHAEFYAAVIHQTARVEARLAEGRDVYDCIRALFPGGSITGAPKVRAMEVIEELEPTRRGVYTGSIGYIGFDGNAELNIAIRTLQLKDGWLDYQIGGGIVWDSDPESEYAETLDKGRAMLEAVESVCRKSL